MLSPSMIQDCQEECGSRCLNVAVSATAESLMSEDTVSIQYRYLQYDSFLLLERQTRNLKWVECRHIKNCRAPGRGRRIIMSCLQVMYCSRGLSCHSDLATLNIIYIQIDHDDVECLRYYFIVSLFRGMPSSTCFSKLLLKFHFVFGIFGLCADTLDTQLLYHSPECFYY